MSYPELAIVFCGALAAGCATRFIVRGIGQAFGAITNSASL